MIITKLYLLFSDEFLNLSKFNLITMEKLKKYLWKDLLQKIINSDDKKLKDKLKCFKTDEEMIEHLKYYSKLKFDDMKRSSGFDYWIRKNIYHYAHGRLLGDKTKAMPDKIYHKLIDYVKEHIGIKQELALEFEGIEGARGEDTVRIKVSDLDFDNHIVHILNRKRNRWYEVPLNKELEQELKQFIASNKKEIKLHNGFVFFSKNPVLNNDHITQKYLKTLVYRILQKLGLNKVYAKSSDGRNLYLYSLHSLRGHAATRVDIKGNHNLKKDQELLDHEPGSADVTMLYIERNNEKDLEGLI